MPFTEAQRFLCVSVHDVAPHTWPQCAHLLQAIREVADIPVSLLVVPAYHHLPVVDAISYDQRLEQRLGLGDELVLHGYTHLDEGSAPGNWWDQYKRRIYTLSEGEFSALDMSAARQRLECGLKWFADRQWTVHGFVAPAWLLSEGAWQALEQSKLLYTTTLHRFYSLPDRRSLWSPSLVYSSRNRWGRVISRQGNAIGSVLLQNALLLRLGLHPNDANFPRTVMHFQKLIEKLLITRTAVTKAAFAQIWSASLNGRNRMSWPAAR